MHLFSTGKECPADSAMRCREMCRQAVNTSQQADAGARSIPCNRHVAGLSRLQVGGIEQRLPGG